MGIRKLFVLLACFSALALCEDFPYKQPPQDVRDALSALPTPAASVSPSGDAVIFMQAVRYPPLAEVAQPMQRLAGIRIDEQTNGLHLAVNYVSYSLKHLPDGAEVSLTLPKDAKLEVPSWSPDGKQFAFTNITAQGIELWIGSTVTGKTRRMDGVRINGVHFGGANNTQDGPVEWTGDNRTLILRTIPAGRGAPPEPPKVPRGPNVQESLGNAGPAPTYEDLLATPHDEDLFDYYATAQLAYLDAASGKVTPLGKPAVYTLVRSSPDQQHLLVGRIHRPYSYQLPATAFPQQIEVWDRNGNTEHLMADLPLSDRVPLGGVRTGPRAYQWMPSKPATLSWAEALDKGDPKAKVPYRDRIMTQLMAPAVRTGGGGQPTEAAKIEQRFRGMQMLENGKALVEDFERVKRVVRTLEVNLDQPGSPVRVVFSRNEKDAYHHPGDPVMKTWPDGRRTVLHNGDEILMTGQGSSPSGDRPFVDLFNLATGKSQRLFQSNAAAFEEVIAVLDESGLRLLTRMESPSLPPNYFLRNGAQTLALTHIPNPVPAALKVKKQLVTYKRADGVPLSFTLYLPPDYKPGTRLPALLWAYPYEFSDAATAGQVTGHAAQAFPELNYHQLGVLHGYALIDNAAMPIIGDPDTVNNTYMDQLLMDARAAVDKAVELGVVDRDRVGVFGHSYGAFMTANLLAHSKLFRAAVAESGAYNRSLTPFGFQAERRTFWEAPDVYTKMSPFWFADQIKTPVLLIHGEADDNTGTYPIQSERMFAAIRGNGGTVRLVMLPAEAHGYRGKESLEHVLYEELSWFDKYLR